MHGAVLRFVFAVSRHVNAPSALEITHKRKYRRAYQSSAT
jgi:hypothetical protein